MLIFVMNPVACINTTLAKGSDVIVISDEDDDTQIEEPKCTKNVFDKEPSFQALTTQSEPTEGVGELDQIEDAPGIVSIELGVRKIIFGSLEVVPKKKIYISKNGLEITVAKEKSRHKIRIMMHDICKVLVHFGHLRSGPVLFYYLYASAGLRIRQYLNKMTDVQDEIYFDPISAEEQHKRIIILPESISQTERSVLESIYGSSSLLEELTWDEANAILVRASPKEVHSIMTSSSQKLLVYPPPPSKGGIPMYMEDFNCLIPGTYLNDVVIDFYLKYLYLRILTEDDRMRTHIFSSCFYLKLTAKAPTTSQENITAAEHRHAKVKSWTKSVDIFNKDFIIIPINKNLHWFLAIICYPGLTGPVRISDNTPVDADTKQKEGNIVLSEMEAMSFGSVEPCAEDSDCDEATGYEDDMEPNSTDEDTDDELTSISTMNLKKPALEAIKQPCILVFDSMFTSGRSNVCATLREFLEVEWKVKNKGNPRDFSKNVFKGVMLKVPQQTNFTDCGVYILQYVESFFKDPILDYRIPIRSMENWFTPLDISSKRRHIMQILLRLIEEQNSDTSLLNLPELYSLFNTHFNSDDDDSDDQQHGSDDSITEEELKTEQPSSSDLRLESEAQIEWVEPSSSSMNPSGFTSDVRIPAGQCKPMRILKKRKRLQNSSSSSSDQH